MMTWHGENISVDGRMRGPYDSSQWEHLREKHLEFEADTRNIHLGVCADDVNPHSQKMSSHSLCCLMLLNYNIPLWLMIKNSSSCLVF